MLILMVTFGQQYDCTAGDLVMGISGLPPTFPSGLSAHIKSKHEGFTFPCSKCDYKAIHNDHLMKHIKSKHGVN